jgi:hypothetical protein
MASTNRRRVLVPLLLAVALATEITGIAIARNGAPRADPVGAPRLAPTTASAGRLSDDASHAIPAGGLGGVRVDAARDDTARSSRLGRPAATAAPKAPRTAAAPPKAPAPKAKAPATSFHGRNRVWIPALGINRSIQSFPCSRSRAPDAGVYRWGCAGTNNVYLMSHAWSTFKPLHDAYVRGRLRTGMKVWYADARGHVRVFRVVWWRVVAPTTAASWAWASQSRPSMTLQTCVGAKSQYRLMVRLVQVG